jgi:hypothetical protein
MLISQGFCGFPHTAKALKKTQNQLLIKGAGSAITQ